MRLFIAFDVSEDAKNILSDTQKKIRFDGKATLSKEFHLTLKFLGEVEDSKLEQLKSALSQLKFQPFDASLSGLGAFPDRNNARVVWVGLEPHNIICAMQKDIETATQKLGFPAEKSFHPHLTLARIKVINNNREFQIMMDNIKVPVASFNINSFKLIKSTLTAQGPIYEVLKEFSAQQ